MPPHPPDMDSTIDHFWYPGLSLLSKSIYDYLSKVLINSKQHIPPVVEFQILKEFDKMDHEKNLVYL